MEIEGSNIQDLINLLNSLANKGNVYIAGAGRNGKIIGEFLTINNIQWIGFIDKNTVPFEINNKKIYSYEKMIMENDFFIVSSYLYEKAIVAELKKKKVLDEKIFCFTNIQDIIYDIYTLCFDAKQYTQKLQIFHNEYYGKRCFIIGNGPSLKILDLEKLNNEVTFASNSIYALYESTFWRPTFYCAYDYVFCKNMMSKKENIKILISNCKAAFTSIVRDGFQYRNSSDIDNLFYVIIKNQINSETGLPLFSDDCSKEVYSSGTVTYLMLQLAIYMGFQEIYLLGVDLSFSVERYKNGKINISEKNNHPKEIEEIEKTFVEDMIKNHGYSYIADVDLHIAGYQAAKEYANTHKIKIYNATRGGKLEVFERVDFDSLFD